MDIVVDNKGKKWYKCCCAKRCGSANGPGKLKAYSTYQKHINEDIDTQLAVAGSQQLQGPQNDPMPHASFMPTSQVAPDFGSHSDDDLDQRPAKWLWMEYENVAGLQDKAFETGVEYSDPNSPAPVIDLNQHEGVSSEGNNCGAIQVQIVILFCINIMIL
jgi:hypothetical protein